MSLSVNEMNYIQNGVVRPLEATLIDLTIMMARRHAQYHTDTEKTVPPENTDATNALIKANALISEITGQINSVFQRLNTRTILQLGNLANFADVRGWDIADWETFLSANMPAVFDDVAGITAAERTAYNAVEI